MVLCTRKPSNFFSIKHNSDIIWGCARKYHNFVRVDAFFFIPLHASAAVLHISRQNNYVRIGPVTEAVLSAIVFVSMIADGPMEMAILVLDPQQKGA
jgi:hypothetical protein